MYFVFCQLNYTSRTSLCPLNIDVFLTFSYRYQQVVRKIAFLSFPQSDNAIFICFTGTICFFLPSFTAFLIAYFLLTKLFVLKYGFLNSLNSFLIECVKQTDPLIPPHPIAHWPHPPAASNAPIIAPLILPSHSYQRISPHWRPHELEYSD